MRTRCMHCGALAAHLCDSGENDEYRDCDACGKRWIPCSTTCRGFHLNYSASEGVKIEVCDDCARACGGEISDADARTWPEAFRAAARLLIARAA